MTKTNRKGGKVCSKCGRDWTNSNWYHDRCNRCYENERYELDPEFRRRKLENAKKWQLEHAEQVRKQNRIWQSENREYLNNYHKVYRLEHPEYRKRNSEYTKKWKLEHYKHDQEYHKRCSDYNMILHYKNREGRLNRMRVRYYKNRERELNRLRVLRHEHPDYDKVMYLKRKYA